MRLLSARPPKPTSTTPATRLTAQGFRAILRESDRRPKPAAEGTKELHKRHSVYYFDSALYALFFYIDAIGQLFIRAHLNTLFRRV